MIRFAITGTGRISDWILKGAIQDNRFKAVAVCSRSMESARSFISRHPEAFGEDALAFDSFEQMLACPQVDAVYIGTPNSTHCPLTVQALAAGKHVLCEKPLACNLSEAEAMADAARRSGRVLMEAMISTLNPNFLKAREALREIGTVRHYNSAYCQYSTKYDALKQGTVANSFDPRMGGGALPDVGVYTTFPLVALFGKPEKVSVQHVMIDTPEVEVEVQGSVQLSYPGMTASLVYSKAVDSRMPTEITGEGGIITLDEIHICRKAEFEPHGTPSSGRGTKAGRRLLSQGLDHDEYYYEFKEFIDVIESGRNESSINSLQVSLDNRALMDEIGLR